MRCAWKEFLSILPAWMRRDVDELGAERLQELRLRLGKPPELIRADSALSLKRNVGADDLNFIVNTASRYSPWAASTMANGYITASGGHRIGLCGEAVIQGGKMTGFRHLNSLCLRVARDVTDIATGLRGYSGSILIIGKPGAGKTTLLRDFIRLRSRQQTVAVVDERGELFPSEGGFDRGNRTDVLTGCPKAQGIDALLRVMGPSVIAVDEITSEEDCQALIRAGWCGVELLATAHASGISDLRNRPVYQPLIGSGLFDTVVVLHSDKSWKAERMAL